jgi:glutamine---fructose-6-phosphate transaminase (isomerizing)
MAEARSAHPYHMYDAIRQQPDRVAELLANDSATIERAADAAAARRRLIFAGIGTSYHAAQIGEHFLRHLTGGRAAAAVEQSFEQVRYPVALGPDDAMIAVSHRGTKNFSVQALQAARAAGALTIAVTGRAAGAGMTSADFVLPTCELEDSFAHTKSYTTALAALAALAIRVAERRGQLRDSAAARAALARVPEAMRRALTCEARTRETAGEIARRERWVFFGAGPNWATAREGALKVKETSYMSSEGFETEQFLHGPMAEMDQRAALVALLAGGPGDDRAQSALRAAGELGVLRIAVAAQGVAITAAERAIEVPAVEEWLSPFVLVIPLQFLAYFVALARGTNPDTGREDQPAHARAVAHYRL